MQHQTEAIHLSINPNKGIPVATDTYGVTMDFPHLGDHMQRLPLYCSVDPPPVRVGQYSSLKRGHACGRPPKTLVKTLHGMLNCEIGGLDCHVITCYYKKA